MDGFLVRNNTRFVSWFTFFLLFPFYSRCLATYPSLSSLLSLHSHDCTTFSFLYVL